MPAPYVPWETCNISDEIQSELNRRKVNRSFNYIKAEQGGWGGTTGEFTKYKGPMVPWIRLCSNGEGSQVLEGGMKKGFIFFGGKDFYKGYGFDTGTNDQVIGYVPEPEHRPHIIKNDVKTSNYPIHVPPPEIERISVTIQKELVRRASIEWVCFSKKQLEYMTPYFLVPGISCILEWGWNHFNPACLIDLTDIGLLKQLNNNPFPLYTDHILKSNGNYDVLFGRIINFEWTIDGNKIRCKTEIMSQDRIYAGLIIDCAGFNISNKTDKIPIDNLPSFVSKIPTRFKEVATKSPGAIRGLEKFTRYLIDHHPDTWTEYAYSVFWGRDTETKTPFDTNKNKSIDFDRLASGTNMWISLGLVMEIINYHASIVTGFRKDEMFRVDIDDVVISGHPNLISTDGTILLIPNKLTPHYFWGKYGEESPSVDKPVYATLEPSDITTYFSVPGKSLKLDNNNIQDVQVNNVTKAGSCKRDDLDYIINWVRHKNSIGGISEFPFISDVPRTGAPGKDYPKLFSGYLKNLYYNVDRLVYLTTKDSSIKTYPKLIQAIVDDISKASGNFWDFRLVSGTGQGDLDPNESAPMKIVDYRFMSTVNGGSQMYSFDYMDADSLLLALSFKPTLSDAQAVNAMNSPVNNPQKPIVVQNGADELLNYKYRDRLVVDDITKDETPKDTKVDAWKETMRALQVATPKSETYQITTPKGIRRLTMPCTEALKILLDDGDEANNPKYIGVMPGIQASFTIQGIGGLRTFMAFLVRNMPEPYSEKNILYRITNIKDDIEAGKWTTTIEAGIIPLRGDVKQRLGIDT